MISDRQRFGYSLTAGVLLEIVALAAAIHWAQTPPPVPKPVIISLSMLPPPPKPVPPAPKPVATPQPPAPTPPKPQPPKPTPVRRVVRTVPRPALTPPLPQQLQPPTDAPVLPEPKPTPPPPPAPASTATPTEIDNFIAAMNAAVQAAVRYPNAARILHLTGSTTLAFDDRDGVISNPKVANSSGSDVLDQAALAALAGANFPAMPDKLRGGTLHMTINVEFTEE